MEKSNEISQCNSSEEETGAEKLSIKKETVSDDIKEFAETAMNELLGWYGYGRESRSCHSRSGSNSSGPESPKYNVDGCGWCNKPVDETTALSSAAATFCSELCFSQSRRANFKKNKACDWCRHVRHTISYVDSQDGASQLQFCSDKCLNQYKMHIFWRETRAHLDIHPHIHGEETSTSGTLITPDLWLNKCKSPEIPPALSSSPSLSPKQGETPQQTSPLPLITVAHPSKLMSFPPPSTIQQSSKRNRTKIQPHQKQQHQQRFKKKIMHNSCSSNSPKNFYASEMPQDLRIRHESPNKLMDIPTDINNHQHQHQNPLIPPSLERNCNYFGGESTAPSSLAGMNRGRKFLEGLLPPPTVLVPYPIILPLPVPIPIPIPIPIPNKLNSDKFREVSSQTEEVPEDNDEVKTDTNQENETANCEKKCGRPLRKRKKIQPKAKIFKNKRLIST